MDTKLTLTGRYYRMNPLDKVGLVDEPIQIDADRTAVVAMHCWNIGEPGGLPVDNNFHVSMGLPVTLTEAARMVREQIAPAVEAARTAGMAVAHVELGSVGQKHPEWMEIPPSTLRTDLQYEGEIPPPAVADQQQRMATRAHGQDYATKSPYPLKDRSAHLWPKPGDMFAVDSLQLHRMLARRRVENLVYTGFASDVCLNFAAGGIRQMAGVYGYRIFVVREATLGLECADWFDQRLATRWGVRQVEMYHGHSIGWEQWMDQCRLLTENRRKA